MRRIHRGPVNSPYKWPVTRKMFPVDDAIMMSSQISPLGSLFCGLQVMQYIFVNILVNVMKDYINKIYVNVAEFDMSRRIIYHGCWGYIVYLVVIKAMKTKYYTKFNVIFTSQNSYNITITIQFTLQLTQ